MKFLQFQIKMDFIIDDYGLNQNDLYAMNDENLKNNNYQDSWMLKKVNQLDLKL